MRHQAAYLKKVGARILSEANDLKRTPDALARELGIDINLVNLVISGCATPQDTYVLAKAMSDSYPVPLSDLWVEADDTEKGVIIMRAGDSRASSRIFNRQNRIGEQEPYYEYRDTAMSRNGPFKPEWISPLRIVTDPVPSNPEIVYNNGHLMHQVTFFVGPVNFYWRSNGAEHCEELSTGDSNFILPFVPHSFASRHGPVPGLIIAVTYGAEVRRGLNEFGMLRPADAEFLAGDMRDVTISGIRLRRMMAEESLSQSDVLHALVAQGISPHRASCLLDNEVPTWEECVELANILSVRPKDILIDPICVTDEVVVSRRGMPRLFPNESNPQYEIRALARHNCQPHVKGFEITVLADNGAPLRHHLHQYVYNFGDAPAWIAWDGAEKTLLNPGDSAYVRPMVEHSFSRANGASQPHLLVMRVPGYLTQEALDEYSTFDPKRRSRAVLETSRWF